MKPGIFDAHCDTLVNIHQTCDFTQGCESLQTDLPRLLEAGVRHQVMAICVEPYKGREKEIWTRGTENFLQLGVTEKPVLHFAIEGCLPISMGWELPCRPLVASLTWNGDNPYAGGIGSSMGLNDSGRKLAQRFSREGTALDVSHLNSGSRSSLLKMGMPVCATHCNAERLCMGVGRNLPDGDIREIAALGGVIGITFVPDFLEEDGSTATIESVINHVEYVAELTSVDNVGFGSDFDGTLKLPPGIHGAQSWHRVIAALENRGWGSLDIEKVAGENWKRFFGIVN
jgi:microsomal dipeptidase-like Zn-dependent dipeptidase